MKRHLRALAACSAMVTSMVLAGTVSSPLPVAAAPEDFATFCPEMTDSVYRLYLATFLREPDQGGFEGWVDNYAVGGWHLARMAQFFSESPEFQERYGSLNNADFVTLIYSNVLGRAPDAGGFAHWTAQLDAGANSRGQVILFFSESEEFVLATDTFDPLAGYLRSYSPTAQWGCGLGDGQVLLTSPRRYWDIFTDNQGGSTVQVTTELLDANGNALRASTPVTLEVQEYGFQWNIDVTTIDPELADRVYGIRFLVSDGENTVYHIAVGTNVLMPADRPSWEGQNGAVNTGFRAAALFDS